MRPIKFRVWDKSLEEMRYSINIPSDYTERNGNLDLINMFQTLNQRYVFMQYTGLKDKNGKEIYEGDIVQNFREKFIVEYWSGQILVSWYLRSINSGDTSELDCFGEYEVIGNIYENPELLGSEDK